MCTGLRLQGAPLCQVQLLQIGTPSCTSGGPKKNNLIVYVVFLYIYVQIPLVFVMHDLNKVMCI